LIASLLLTASASAQSTRAEIFADIDRHLSELSEMTGLKPRRAVPAEIITREKVNQFLQQRIKEVATPEELRAEELMLKKFGLAPADFDLVKTTIDLLTEQAAAFYDYHRKRLYLTDWTSSETQQAALVHELAHALADQHFNLERFVKQAGKNDDTALARLAVAEGQASWLMSEHLARKMGLSLRGSLATLEMMSRAAEALPGQYPIFDQAPLYLRETLIFPYLKGMLFQHAVYEKMGAAAFSQIFRRPPVSTQQILHPEDYLAGKAPSSPALPEVPDKRKYKDLIGGTIGELDHAILLRQYVGKERAAEVAPHWRGGQYTIFEARADKRAVLTYSSDWDEPRVARDFFHHYAEVLRQKWKRMQVTGETTDRISGQGDDGYFVLKLNGSTVSSLEGLPQPVR